MPAVASDLRVLRDPASGGLAASLNEIAAVSGCGVVVQGRAVPVPPPVAGARAMPGPDPMYAADEGKLVAFVPREHADAVPAVCGARRCATRTVRMARRCQRPAVRSRIAVTSRRTSSRASAGSDPRSVRSRFWSTCSTPVWHGVVSLITS
jgi:thiamine monophosphate kinase